MSAMRPPGVPAASSASPVHCTAQLRSQRELCDKTHIATHALFPAPADERRVLVVVLQPRLSHEAALRKYAGRQHEAAEPDDHGDARAQRARPRHFVCAADGSARCFCLERETVGDNQKGARRQPKHARTEFSIKRSRIVRGLGESARCALPHFFCVPPWTSTHSCSALCPTLPTQTKLGRAHFTMTPCNQWTR